MDFARDNFALKLVAALLAFVAAFLAVRTIDGSGELPEFGSAGAGVREGLLPTATTQERIEALRGQTADAALGSGGLHRPGSRIPGGRIGETEDPALYADAERSLQTALEPRSE